MNYIVKKLPFTENLRSYLAAHHYTKTFPSGVQVSFGLLDGERLLGVATFGRFPGSTVDSKYSGCIHFSRMFVEDECPKNTESYFIGKCLRLLSKENRWLAVISYADPMHGHVGTIYKASNFKLIGESAANHHYVDPDGSVVHGRSVAGWAKKEGITAREMAAAADLVKTKGQPKLIYRYDLKMSRHKSVKGNAVECAPEGELPNDFDPVLHGCVALRGRIFFVDRSYIPLLTSRRCYYAGSYLRFVDGKYARSFHRYVTNPGPGYVVDHINRNKNDNRSINLRVVHPAVNNLNKHVDGMRGVHFKRGRYEASIVFCKKNYYLGRFDSEVDAARAYDLAAIDFFGRYAQLNFPSEHKIDEKVGKIEFIKPGEVVRNSVGKLCEICQKIAYRDSSLCAFHLRQSNAFKGGARKCAPRVIIASKKCSIEGCERDSFSRNLCGVHYTDARIQEGYEKPQKKQYACSVLDCSSVAWQISERLCRFHWREKHQIPKKKMGRPITNIENPTKPKPPCVMPGCGAQRMVAGGYCYIHRSMKRKPLKGIEFGQKLKVARESAGLSKAACARAMGYSNESPVCGFEDGSKGLKHDRLEKLLPLLNVDMKYFE